MSHLWHSNIKSSSSTDLLNASSSSLWTWYLWLLKAPWFLWVISQLAKVSFLFRIPVRKPRNHGHMTQVRPGPSERRRANPMCLGHLNAQPLCVSLNHTIYTNQVLQPWCTDLVWEEGIFPIVWKNIDHKEEKITVFHTLQLHPNLGLILLMKNLLEESLKRN